MRHTLEEDIKMIMKKIYDHHKLNMATLDPIFSLRFGEVMGPQDAGNARPYDEMVDPDKI